MKIHIHGVQGFQLKSWGEGKCPCLNYFWEDTDQAADPGPPRGMDLGGKGVFTVYFLHGGGVAGNMYSIIYSPPKKFWNKTWRDSDYKPL